MPGFSLYFHVPFCTRKCDYCHFYVIPNQERFQLAYMEGLAKEWQIHLPAVKQKQLLSIYFGGGTPSLLGPNRIATILSWVKQNFSIENIEVTLEANPENITCLMMKDYRAAGVNRVSIGIQSFDDRLLKRLSRTHDSEMAKNAVLETHNAGIENISIDLMYDLPSQSLSGWHRTLTQAVKLPITHLSLYNLTIEPETVFYKKRKQLTSLLPDEDVSVQMYDMAAEILQENGLKQYEISAFASDNRLSVHNTGYWTARPFIGLGPSAFSYWNGSRIKNVSNLSKYNKMLQSGIIPADFEESLEDEARKTELLAVQLRLRSGVPLNEFENKHGALSTFTKDSIAKLIDLQLLEQSQNHLFLSEKGIRFYDSVASELIHITHD